MPETNITRRRVMQGAGAVGFATLGGSTVISAQEEDNGTNGEDGGDGETAAFRVAHASPDAPGVNVRLFRTDDGVGGDQNGGGGDQNGSDGQDGGGDGQNGDGDDQGPDVEIEGLGFRDVSGYNEVDPGSYQVQVLPAEGGLLGGVLGDLFGDDSEDETILFEDELDLEAGTVSTVVAFGEVRQGPLPAEEGEAEQGNETDGQGENGNETTGQSDEMGGEGNETGGGNESEGTGAETGGGDAPGEQIVESLGFGEQETVELQPGDYTLLVRDAGGGQTDAMPDDGQDGNETAGDGNETGDGADETAGDGDMAGGGQPFQVTVLEDDLEDPGGDNARVRLFHAVPDVDAVSIRAATDEELAEEQGGAAGNETGDGAGGGQPGDGAGEDQPADGAGDDQPADDGAGNQPGDGAGDGQTGQPGAAGENAREAVLSAEGQTVYSGFAVGYFDPQAAAPADEGDGDGNETDGMGNETGDGMGDETSDEANVTDGQADGNGDGNETGGEDTDQEGEEVAEDPEGEQFELVTVQDAQEGERADGGTDGILRIAPTTLD